MNLRLFSIALMASAIPLSVKAGNREIALSPGDFLFDQELSGEDDSELSVRLSKSGKAKLRRLHEAGQLPAVLNSNWK